MKPEKMFVLHNNQYIFLLKVLSVKQNVLAFMIKLFYID